MMPDSREMGSDLEPGDMMRIMKSGISSCVAVFLACTLAQAGNTPLESHSAFSGYELRLAALSHNIEPGGDEHGDIDLAGSVLFPKVETGLSGVAAFWIPRVHIGGTGNFTGKTSFGYAGVTWTLPVAQSYFFSVDFGGALNNGEPKGIVGERVAMGCNATFRESAALGRSLSDRVSISATIEHFSNAGLCEQNSGITNVGVMLGYQF